MLLIVILVWLADRPRRGLRAHGMNAWWHIHTAIAPAADQAATRIQLERTSRLSVRWSKPPASAPCWRPCSATVEMITARSSASSQTGAHSGTWLGRDATRPMPPAAAASTPGRTTSAKRRLCAAS